MSGVCGLILLVYRAFSVISASAALHLEPTQEGAVTSKVRLAGQFFFVSEGGVVSRKKGSAVSDIMKMYVGNIPFSTSDDELRDLFGEFGDVTDVHIPQDRDSGRPRGFAFVTMDSKEAMEKAIEELDGADFGGRNLRVNEAKPREDRGGGGGGRGGRDQRGGGRERW